MADSPFFPSRARGRAAMGLPPESATGTIPTASAFDLQKLSQMLQRRNEMAQTPPAAANIGSNVGTGIGGAIAPPTPPVTVQATPPMASPMAPPAVPPGDQSLPSTLTQSATAADAFPKDQSGPNTPGFWQRFNKAISSGQVPEGYRGVMGELIKNG